MFKLVTIIIVGLLLPAYCADILVALMANGKSHGGSMVPLLERLVNQGHNVTVYMEAYDDFVYFGDKFNYWYLNMTGERIPFHSGAVSCQFALEDHRSEFDRIVAYPWDLVLTDSLFTTCGYAIASLAKAGHVMMHSSTVEVGHGYAKSYASQYLTAPSFLMGFENPEHNLRSFASRLSDTYDWIGTLLMFDILADSYMKTALKSVIPRFDFLTYSAQSSMSFTDMPLQLHLPLSISNELFSYGAYCKAGNKLDADLETFVTQPDSNGTIVIAFGTIIDWNIAPEAMRLAFAEALNNLVDYRIIWAYNGPEVKHGQHIRTMKWIPQTELLNHQRTKLLITHGGLKSLKEAACAQMPTIFMPIFGEQVRNAWLAKYHGFGRILSKKNLNAQYVLGNIQETLNDPAYKRNAARLRRFFEESPLDALSEGTFRINRLLKYGGRLPYYYYIRATGMNFIKYFNLDILLGLPIIFTCILIIK